MNILSFLLPIFISLYPNLNHDILQKDHNVINSENSNQEFYLLKTYTFGSSEQQNKTDNYLEFAYLPALKRQGFKNIGVFNLKTSPADTVQKTYMLIPSNSVEKLIDLEKKLANDKNYLKAADNYINTDYTQAPYLRIESTILKAFIDMPKMSSTQLAGKRSERIYELRSYESATEKYYRNKLDMFNAGGEIKLFDRLGFNAVFYGDVIFGSKMPNLMYLTRFENQQSRDEHWKQFVESPEWVKLKSNPIYQHNVSHIDIMFLYPTEYSDY